MVLICEDKMKRLLLTTAFILFTSSAFAFGGCGPKVSLGLSHNQDKGDQTGYRNYHTDGNDSRIDLSMTWNLGEDYCTEQEYADLQKKKADERKTTAYAKREEIRELKETLSFMCQVWCRQSTTKGQML